MTTKIIPATRDVQDAKKENAILKAKLNAFNFRLIVKALRKGTKLMDFNLKNLYLLTSSPDNRQSALISIFYPKIESFDFNDLSSRDVVALSDIAYQAIRNGMEALIKNAALDINVSIKKLENAGRDILQHNAAKDFGGETLRNYLTYLVMNNKSKPATTSLTENEFNACKFIAGQRIESLSYKNIKSLPFNLINITERFEVEEKKIKVPDVEAKINLRKILSDTVYDESRVAELDLWQATSCEYSFVKRIRAIVENEIDIRCSNVIKTCVPENMQNKLLESIKLKNLMQITRSGQIKDIIEYAEENISTVIKTSKDAPSRVLSADETDKFFRIEYASCTEDCSPEWISEVIDLLNFANYPTYPIVTTCLLSHCIPRINKSSIADFKYDDYKIVSGYIMQYAKTDNIAEKAKLLNLIALHVCNPERSTSMSANEAQVAGGEL